MESTLVIIYVILAICVVLAIGLAVVLGYVWYRDNKRKGNFKSKEEKSNSGSKSSKIGQTKLQGIESMSKFLAFDTIVDSMIVRKNRTQYVMVLKCKGINYDLLGEEEKLAVESGFVQFLNTLKFPIQIYIQSRSLNLKNNIDKYQEKLEAVNADIVKIDNQIKREKANGRLDLVQKLEFDRRRKVNILEYGVDIANYVARLSQNRNVLQQNTYVAISYYTSEFGGQISNYSKEEVDNIAFSELYTRAQTLSSALSSSGVSSKVMTSEELAELLYIAYNRDDSELINIKKSVEAQYDSLYNTSKDIMDKQKEMIEEKVNQEAVHLTEKSLAKANRILKLRQQNREEIRRRAIAYVERYKGDMTEELFNETKKQIQKTDITKPDYDKDEPELDKKEETTGTNSEKTEPVKRNPEENGKEKRELTEEQKRRIIEERRRMARRQELRREAEMRARRNIAEKGEVERTTTREKSIQENETETGVKRRVPRRRPTETSAQ